MNDNERLKLDEMIKTNNASDYTNDIRVKKHSVPFKKDVNKMLKLMKDYKGDELENLLLVECSFIHQYYTDIFNKLKNNELDVLILFKFLDILTKIENSEIDQHTGSYYVGKLLKELYIDSALKKSNKNDEKYKTEEKEFRNITWKEFKAMKE